MNTDKSYTVLARRTRPQSFAQLFGQSHISRALGQIVNSGKIPHAFLLTGTRGTGKTSTARILSKSLCCEKGPTLEPCQICQHCVQITASAHEDVFEIDGASNTGVDNIRELKELVRFLPKSSRYRVIIIDEVHMLSTSAFNALLKTLEEPPPQVVFILATTELQKVPVTVRSRCLVFSFRKVAVDDIAIYLSNILDQDKIQYEIDGIKFLAREAKGSLRDALSLLEQALAICDNNKLTTEQVIQNLSQFGEEHSFLLFKQICQKNVPEALSILLEADASNIDLSSLLEITACHFKDALLLSELKDQSKAFELTHLLESEQQRLRDAFVGLSAHALSENYRLLMQASKDTMRAGQALGWAQVAVLDAISRAEWLSPGQLLSQIALSATGQLHQASIVQEPQTQSQSFTARPMVTTANNTPVPNSVQLTTHKPIPEVSANVTVGAVGAVDFQLLKNLSASLEKMGQVMLAAKLRNLKFKTFDLNTIELENAGAQTQIFSPSERDLLLEAFAKLQLKAPSLEGLSEASARQLRPAPLLLKTNPVSKETGMKPIQSFLRKASVPAPQPSVQQQPLSPMMPEPTLSLVEHTQRNNDEAFQKKAEKVLKTPELQDLLKLAKSAVVLPLKP